HRPTSGRTPGATSPQVAAVTRRWTVRSHGREPRKEGGRCSHKAMASGCTRLGCCVSSEKKPCTVRRCSNRRSHASRSKGRRSTSRVRAKLVPPRQIQVHAAAKRGRCTRLGLVGREALGRACVVAWRLAHVPAERCTERARGAVTDAFRDFGERELVAAEQILGECHAPGEQ